MQQPPLLKILRDGDHLRGSKGAYPDALKHLQVAHLNIINATHIPPPQEEELPHPPLRVVYPDAAFGNSAVKAEEDPLLEHHDWDKLPRPTVYDPPAAPSERYSPNKVAIARVA